MPTKKELEQRVAELEAELASRDAALELLLPAIENMVAAVAENQQLITQKGVEAAKPKGLTGIEKARTANSMNARAFRRPWARNRYVELRATPKYAGEGKKMRAQSRLLVEMRERFGSAYCDDHLRKEVLKGLD